jgi:CHAT domain-containing protein/Flp pilus assembly protein TadD
MIAALFAALLVAMPVTGQAQQHENSAELHKKVNALEAAGKYAEAIPYARRALEIEESRSGPNQPNVVAIVLNRLAMLYAKDGRYADAETFYQRSLTLRAKARGPFHPDVATVLNNLAALYLAQGRYADAESPLKRSLAIREKALGPAHLNVAATLNNLAELYRLQGRYTDAEPLIKRALAIREKVLRPDHPDVAVSLNNLAAIYDDQGRYVDAEQFYKRSLAVYENALGPNHPDVALSLMNLAVFYGHQGRYADAEPLLRRSLAIREKTLGSGHPDVATTLSNLAVLHAYRGRYAEAESLSRRALEIREKALGSDHPDVATALNNLAMLYKEQSRYVDAEPLLKRASAIWEKALGSDHRDVATALNNLAALYADQSRYADALPLIRTAANKGFDRKTIHLAVLTGALTNALITRTEALDESYEVIQRATSSAASNAISQLSIRFAAGNDELAQLIRRDQDLGAENENLDKFLIAAVGQEPSKRDLPTEQRIRDRLKSISIERAEIGTRLNQRFPNFAALSKPTPITVKDTQLLLSDDEALVVFDFDDKSNAWIITGADADWVELKITAKQLEEQVKALRSSLSFDIDNKPFDTQLAFKIYQETLGTIEDKLQGKTRLSVVTNGALTSLPLQLLITQDPSGKAPKDVDWLMRSYAITNLPSVASLKTLRATASSSSAAKPMIGFADPVFSKDGSKQVAALRSVVNFYEGGRPDLSSLARALQQLPETANEVRAIGEVLKAGGNDIKLGIFASEATVKQTKLDDYRVVYFATHGLVAGEVEKFAKVKAEPALALTIPDKPADLDDGLLTASEIAQLKLNAEWVVLSACNTAAEGNPGAEALSGLARAFFYAGARSLIVSHWEVDSDATVKLMTKMFQAIATDPKLSHAEALRQSMLAMVDSASSDRVAHPRIWAPFVVVGEPAKPLR